MIEESQSELESLPSLPAARVNPGGISLIEFKRVITLEVWTPNNIGVPLDITKGLRGSE